MAKQKKGFQKPGTARQDKTRVSSIGAKPDKASSIKASAVSTDDFAFGKINYIIMLGGLLLIVIGYALMAGGKSSTPQEFNPEIFSFQRITLAPLLVLAGLCVQVWAIVKKAD